MSTLADQLTKESVHTLHNAFEQGVEYLRKQPNQQEPGFTRGSFAEVGEPMLHYIHARLMAKATPNRNREFPGYPFISSASVNTMLKELGVSVPEEVLATRKGRAVTPRLTGEITRMLQYVGVARYERPYWYLKPWSDRDRNRMDFVTHDKARKALDPREEKRIVEESNKPVVIKRDLRTIKTPGPDAGPAEVLEFIERFIPSALKVQDDLARAIERITDLEAEIEAAKEDEKKEEWKGIASRIGDLFGSAKETAT